MFVDHAKIFKLQVPVLPVCYIIIRLGKVILVVLSINFLKVTIHLERCFQFSVCNFVNTHRTPTIYISMESL